MDNELLNVIISFISLIVSSFLTIYMFIKDKKLQDKQMELQKVIFTHQEKQDKLVYINQEKPYIESTFKLIYRSYDMVTDLLLCCSMAKKDNASLAKMFKDALAKHKELFTDFDFKFDIATSYSENNLKDLILDIKSKMLTIEKDINSCILIHDHKLKPTETHNYDLLKIEIKTLSEGILSTQDQVREELKIKLNIPTSDTQVLSLFDDLTDKPTKRKQSKPTKQG